MDDEDGTRLPGDEYKPQIKKWSRRRKGFSLLGVLAFLYTIYETGQSNDPYLSGINAVETLIETDDPMIQDNQQEHLGSLIKEMQQTEEYKQRKEESERHFRNSIYSGIIGALFIIPALYSNRKENEYTKKSWDANMGR